MSDRKAHIINTAITLFLKEGVSVSTARIADQAGVANGSLFNAFPTKQKLIDAIYLKSKAEMTAVFEPHLTRRFDREGFHQVWTGYLTWARAAPDLHRIMNFLLDAGLASPEARASADDMMASINHWFQDAFDTGRIRGPNIGFVSKLIHTHLDLVVEQNLTSKDEQLAFDMLCNNLGLSQ